MPRIMWSRLIRQLVHPIDLGDFGRAHADPMHLDVVGMPVAAVVVVDGEHVGALLAQHVGEPRRGILHGACQKQAGSSLVGSPIMPESR